MKFSLAAIVLGQLVTASLVERQDDCTSDGCLRAVEATVFGTSRLSAAQTDCSSYMTDTFTELFATTTVLTTTETLTATTSASGARAAFGKRFPVPQAASTTARSGKTIPTYASACSRAALYSSACSCFGFPAETLTVARFTTITELTTTTTVVTVTQRANTTSSISIPTSATRSSYTPGSNITWSVGPGYNYSLPYPSTSAYHPTSYSWTYSWTNSSTMLRPTNTTSHSSSTSSLSTSSSSVLFNTTSSVPTATSSSTTSSATSSPTCIPGVCGFYQACNSAGGPASNSCICAKTTEGTGLCVDRRTSCTQLRDCRRGCGLGETCLEDTCCGRPVCVGALSCPAPRLLPRVVEGVASGPGRRNLLGPSLGDVHPVGGGAKWGESG